VFTRPDAQPYHPDHFTKRLRFLIDQCGLPPVRLHDLRHGAASLAHTAGADLKTVQDQFGHASIVLTADTYTSVLPAAQHKAAEATARLILTTARNARAKISRKTRHRRPEPPPRPANMSITQPPTNPPNATKTAGQSRHNGHRRGMARTGSSDNERPVSVHAPQGTTTHGKTAGQRVGRRGFEPRT
jgi:hypothetical protein